VKTVYIAHPLGQDGPERERNRENAARWVGWLATNFDIAPVADWIVLSGVWSEEHRERGLAIDFALIARCDEVWMVGGRISPGMAAEAGRAAQLGKRVYDLTRLGFAAPTSPSPESRKYVAEIVGMT
jgi:hypothetical protein